MVVAMTNGGGWEITRTCRIKIITSVDRPHITYDILTVLHKYNIGILMMEVYTYVIYLKIPVMGQELWKKILGELGKIHGFESTEEIDDTQ